MADIRKKIAKLRQAHDRRQTRTIITAGLAAVVALGTAISLFLVAFAQTRETYDLVGQEGALSLASLQASGEATAKDWERTLPTLSDDMSAADKLVAVATSQVGQSESTDDFIVEGDDTRGYTHYGAKQGNPYGPWNRAFALFCLNYAGIDDAALPQASNGEEWIVRLGERFVPASDAAFEPQPGDIVFFDADDGVRVAIVTSAQRMTTVWEDTGTEEEFLEITAIEGDKDDAVREVTLRSNDDPVRGYASLPARLREVPVVQAEAPVEPDVVDVTEAPDANEAPVEAPQVLTASANGFDITVDLGGVGQPGYALVVEPLDPTTEQMNAVEESLSEDLGDGIVKQARVDRGNVRAFDIRVVDAWGNEVAPGDTVRVSVVAQREAEPSVGESKQADAPEVVHLGDAEPEVLSTTEQGEGFAFETDGFSPYVFVYTVDYAYEGYEWDMAGGSTAWLSTLLEGLGCSIDAADVASVEFSNPDLIGVEFREEDGERDWLLKSIKPFNTAETLVLAMNDGTNVVISVTDDVEGISIKNFLTHVEFHDGDQLVGSSLSPDPMLVIPGHEYTMQLHFAEDENDATKQFPDNGVMAFAIPDNIHINFDRAFDNKGTTENPVWQIEFDIVLDRKHTLHNNTITYVPAEGTTPAYLKIEWNASDRANYKLLTASPRTSFMLSLPYTMINVDKPTKIEFSDTVTLGVDKDPTFDVDLEKKATQDIENDPSIVTYEVVATATGDAGDVTITDEMGDALTLIGEPTVTYKDQYGNVLTNKYETGNTSYTASANGKGFELKFNHLLGSDKAILTYQAKVDFSKLGGKENIKTTSKNTVIATDSEGNELDKTSAQIEDVANYLQIGKSRGSVEYRNSDGVVIHETDSEEENYVGKNWETMSVEWQVIYNPDRKIDVEGAEITDKIWAGARQATTYDTTRPFTVTAYENGTFTKGELGANDSFEPSGTGIKILDSGSNGWNNTTVNNTELDHNWQYTIPSKSASNLESDKHYTYVITYYTTVNRTGTDASKGYVGNEAIENIASITRDKAIEFPGIIPEPDNITVDKTHGDDAYETEGDTTNVYSQWTITFDRRSGALDRAVVEDTLPHTTIGNTIYPDTFVNKTINENPNYGWQVSGLKEGEACVPSVSADGYDVVFRFYKNYVAEGSPQNEEGLKAGSSTGIVVTAGDVEGSEDGNSGYSGSTQDGSDTITITYWTLNSNTWIKATSEGKASNEHWNYVHLVLNGKEAADRAYAIPKPSTTIEKRFVRAGTWTNKDGIEMPIYRYTLTLNGMSDSSFTGDGDNRMLVITDEFDADFVYLPISDFGGGATKTYLYPEGSTEGTAQDKRIATLANKSSSDEALVRISPVADTTWDATITGGTDVTTGADNKKTKTITIKVPYDDAMQFKVKNELGQEVLDDDNNPVKVFGAAYEISYYLALDHNAIIGEAQGKLEDEDKTKNTKALVNTATWTSDTTTAGSQSITATVGYDLKPVHKTGNYNQNNETVTYRVEINPLKLTVNEGLRYSVTDTYEGVAVDFQTVQFETDPPNQPIEWSYHNNNGTFWIPDRTKVVITYEGWPVGTHDGTEHEYTNTVSMAGFTDPHTGTAKLEVDHEGHASTYSVRIFKFEDDNMDKPLPGAVFQLFTVNERNEKVPMTYGVNYGYTDSDGVGADSKAFGAYGEEDDIEWGAISNQVATAAGIVNEEGFIPTPERHKVGDKIYFITGRGEGNSAQLGFADVMLSQARDGVSLKKGKQYYLREVLEPTGHLKENIDWQFIIDDSDYFPKYVYSDGSILQMSNASSERVLTVRKTFDDRTYDKRITYDQYQKDVQFEIVGTSLTDSNKVIYNKTLKYSDFMRVDTPIGNDKYKTEYLLIINTLDPGNYTVREVRASAKLPARTELSTSVDGSATVTEETNEGGVKQNSDPEPGNYGTGTDSDTGDPIFTFTVPDSETTDQGTILKHTSAEAEFTNVYVDEDPVSLTIGKSWDGSGKAGFTPKRAEFALYADGEKYNVSRVDGGNERGNVVVEVNSDSTSPWNQSVTISNLPRLNAAGEQIVWTVEEVGATYNAGGGDITVPENLLNEHFTVTTNANKVEGTNRYSFKDESTDEGSSTTSTTPKQIQFTNKLNSLITVNVNKVWGDGADSHSTDKVFFDLYRTTNELTTVTDYSGFVKTNNLVPVLENIPLTAENPKWSYSNELMEKYTADGDKYHYFVVERSVAGYVATYSRSEVATTETASGSQLITITNTPILTNETDPKPVVGNIQLKKKIDGQYASAAVKKYKFTLWNSGKYLQENGSLGNVKHEFEVTTDGTEGTLTINNVRPGIYVLKEVGKSAEVNGYTLSVSSGNVLNAAVDDFEANVEVTKDSTTAAEVTVTNTYTREDPGTDFTFGKLWVIPDTNETTTMPWPNNVSTTMQVQRRIKGTNDEHTTNGADANFKLVYVIGQGGSESIDYDSAKSSVPAGMTPVPQLNVVEDTNGDIATFHEYKFKLEGLEKYDANGNEWEYFVTETAVTDTAHSNANLLENNNTGRKFVKEYGYVNGIAATPMTGWKTASSNDGMVEYSINRLSITAPVKIPVQKAINGWLNWGGTSADTFPEFTFALYNSAGQEVKVGDVPVTVTVPGDLVSGEQYAEFDVTSVVQLNKMTWWPEDNTLRGTYSFWIKENPNPAITDDNKLTTAYNGITNSGTAQVTLTVIYDWQTGQLTNTAKVTSDVQPEGTIGRAIINNIYDPGKVQLTVTKEWDDANNQDGYRRPVQFKVEASYTDGTNSYDLDKVWFVKNGDNGTKVQDIITLNDSEHPENEYRITVEPGSGDSTSTSVELPEFYEGHKIAYTVQEMPEESVISEGASPAETVTLANKYTQAPLDDTSKMGAKNSHTPEKIGVSFEKKWDDTNNTVNPDHGTVTMRLHAKYLDASGHLQDVTHESIEQAGTGSPWHTYLEQFADKSISNSVLTGNWSDLPRFAPGEVGKLVDYSIEEVGSTIPLGYVQITSGDERIKTNTSAEAGGTAENALLNKYETVDVPLKKIWADDNDRDGLRNELTSITMNLSARTADGEITIGNDFVDSSGTKVAVQKTVTGDNLSNTWEGESWTGLPKYYHGKEITYTVTETPNPVLSGYAASGEQEITNTREIERTQVKLIKTWKDNKNQDGKRPPLYDYVRDHVHLYAKLDVDDNIETELVIGESVQGQSDTYYLKTKTGDNASTEDYEVDSVKPTVTLAGSSTQGTATSTYEITYKYLPKHKNHGVDVTYWMTETDSVGHVLATSGSNKKLDASGDLSLYEISENMAPSTGNTFTVTNTYTPETINIEAAKTWNFKSGLSPEEEATIASQVTYKLVAKVGDTELDITNWTNTATYDHTYSVAAEQPGGTRQSGTDIWKVTWSNLPKYNPDSVGQPISYSVVEDPSTIPESYHEAFNSGSVTSSSVVAGDTGNINITNTYEDVTVTATKNWDDANNQDGLRKPVKFQLQKRVGDSGNYSDVGVETKTVAAVRSRSAIWEGLPAWENNQPVYYKVVELAGDERALADYTTSDSGFSRPNSAPTGTYQVSGTVTNKHTPYTRSATFTKEWDHKGASNYLPPDAFKAKLHLWARVGNSDPFEVKTWANLFDSSKFGTNDSDVIGWRNHATISKSNGNNNYTIEVAGLPTNKPRAAETDSAAEPISYFITEDDINYYTATYPSRAQGSDLPSDKVAEGETLTNTRDTGSLQIGKTVSSDLAEDFVTDFTFNVATEPPITGEYMAIAYTNRETGDTLSKVTFDREGKANGQIKLKSGQTITISGLPIGVTYTVSEQQKTGFDCDQTNIAVTLRKDATSSASFTNTRKVGSLKVKKSVISAVRADKTKKYKFKILLGGLTDDAKDKKYSGIQFTNSAAEIELAHGEEKVIDGLPTGATYSVTELSADSSNASYYYGDKMISSSEKANGTVSTTQSEASFTNTRKTGQLTLTKALENAIPSDDGDVFYFDVKLTGDDTNNLVLDANVPITVGNVVIKAEECTDKPYYDANSGMIRNVPVVWHSATGSSEAGGTTTITGLPLGTAFEAVELASGYVTTGTTAANIDRDTGKEEGRISDEASTAAFTNVRKTSSLKLTKAVTSPVVGDDAADYTLKVTLATSGDQNAPRVSGTFGMTGIAGQDEITFNNGEATVTLKPGEGNAVTISGIPTDVTYTVTEAGAGDFDKKFETKSAGSYQDSGYQYANGQISAATTADVRVTNTRKVGNIAVKKSVISAVASDKSHDFKFKVTVAKLGNSTVRIKDGTYGGMTFTDNVAWVVLKDDETAMASGLPTGWTYTVEETAVDQSHTADETEASFLGLFDTTWTRTVGSSATGSMNGDGRTSNDSGNEVVSGSSTVTFTNTRRTGSLQLTKALTNAIPSDDGDTFYFDVELTGDDGEKLVLDENAPIKVNGASVSATTGSGHALYYDADNGVIRNVPVTWHSATGPTEAGGTTTITGLPLGTTYEAAELAAGYVTTGTTAANIDRDSTQEANPRGGTISATASTAAFTNVRKTSSLKLTKAVDSPVTGDLTADYTLKVILATSYGQNATRVSGTFGVTGIAGQENITFTDGEATVTLKPGEGNAVTISGIPTDVTYTVSEVGADDFEKTFETKSGSSYQDSGQQSANGQIDATATADVRVTNTRKVGNIAVKKSVDSSVASDKRRPFKFSLRVAKSGDNNAKIADGEYDAEGAYSKVTFKDNVAEFTLTDDKTVTVKGLPIGWAYTVEELSAVSSDDSYFGVNMRSSAENETGAVSDAQRTASFTNTRKTGELKLTKIVQSEESTDQNRTFNLKVSLAMPGGEKVSGAFNTVAGETVTFTDGEATVHIYPSHDSTDNSITITGLPAGVEYTVTEELGEDANIFGYVVGYPEGDGASHDIVADNTKAVTVTNTRAIPLSIYKVSAETGAMLGGAEFTLKRVPPTSAWTDIELVSKPTTGCLVEKTADASTTEQVLRLVPATYELTETKAPIGYNKLAQPAVFTVRADGTVDYSDETSEYGGSTKQNGPITGNQPAVKISITNSTGVELPSTGGEGTAALYGSGLALLALSAVLLTRKRLAR